MQIEKYDIARLQEAKRTLERVHEYYYGSSKEVRFVRLLGTILKKLETLITVAEEQENA